ncbi:MAG: creatininase family protein [Pseudomonadota bacterium]
MKTSCWVEDLPWQEVERRLAHGALAILPVGAAAKEHGPHLPLATDAIQARHFAAQLAQDFDTLVWPTVSYGYYPVFTEYPGSVSLKESTFAQQTDEIVTCLLASGAQRIGILNTGISTIPALETLVKKYGGGRVLLINCYSGPRLAKVENEICRQTFGGHADEMETSLMLAIAPEQVDMSKAVSAVTRIERGMFNRSDPQGANYSPSGVNGDPTLASREKGEALLAALLEDLRELLGEFSDRTGTH